MDYVTKYIIFLIFAEITISDNGRLFTMEINELFLLIIVHSAHSTKLLRSVSPKISLKRSSL